MMEKTRRDQEEMERTFQVPIERHIPEDLPVLWSNNFVIQHTEREFILTFFQITPPILLEPTAEDLDAIKSVRAIAVARIALTPQTAHELLEVMQTNIGKFEDRHGETDVTSTTQ